MILLHIFCNVLKHKELAFEIGVQNTVQIFSVHFINKTEVKNSGIIHEDINPSEFRSNLINKPFDLLFL